MLLSFLFAALPVMAQPRIFSYEARVNPKATSYRGEKFDRRLKIEVDYLVTGSVSAKAATSEKTYCTEDDAGEVMTCFQSCDTSVSFTVGSMNLRIMDLDSNEVLNFQQNLGGAYLKSEEKGTRTTCETPLLDGEMAVSVQLQKELKFKDGQRMAGVSVGDFAPFQSEHTLKFVLKSLGENNYEATLADVNSSPVLYWNYYEAEIWGVAERALLKMKSSDQL